MRPSLTLSEIQSRFKALLKARDLPEEDSIGIRGSERASFATRLGIYHHGVHARFLKSLAEDFPRLQEILGSEVFSAMIRRYLERYPSRYPNLARIGQHLPRFLREDPEYRDLPWLSELAGLEWQRCVSLWSEDPENRRDFAELVALPEEEQMSQQLLLAPSTRFFQAAHLVHGQEPSRPGALSLVLFRHHAEVRMLELSSEKEELLFAIREGEPLGQLVERMERSEALARSAMDWITEWVKQGLIVSFNPAIKFS